MESIVSYFFKASVYMLVFYLFYRIFLNRDTLFGLNRFYLLSTILLSLGLPFAEFIVIFPETGNTYSAVLNTVIISAEKAEATVHSGISSIGFISILYFAGAGAFLLLFLYRIFVYFRLLRNSTTNILMEREVHVNPSIASPLSIGRKIFIPNITIPENDLKQILAHEAVHSKHFHTFDLIFIEILKIVLWFNPFVYLYGVAIRENHEYTADNEVLKLGYDKSGYLELLFNQIKGGPKLRIADNFNYSLIKRRFTMMTQFKSGKASGLKILFVVPIAILLLLAFSETKSFYETEKTAPSVEITNTNPDGLAYNIQDEEDENTVAEIMPEFGYDMISFLSKNIKYPAEERKNGIEGTSYVKIYVDKKARISKVRLLKSSGNQNLDEEALRVCKLLPDASKPAMQKGKPVGIWMTIPIKYQLDSGTKNKPEKKPVDKTTGSINKSQEARERFEEAVKQFNEQEEIAHESMNKFEEAQERFNEAVQQFNEQKELNKNI